MRRSPEHPPQRPVDRLDDPVDVVRGRDQRRAEAERVVEAIERTVGGADDHADHDPRPPVAKGCRLSQRVQQQVSNARAPAGAEIRACWRSLGR